MLHIKEHNTCPKTTSTSLKLTDYPHQLYHLAILRLSFGCNMAAISGSTSASRLCNSAPPNFSSSSFLFGDPSPPSPGSSFSCCETSCICKSCPWTLPLSSCFQIFNTLQGPFRAALWVRSNVQWKQRLRWEKAPVAVLLTVNDYAAWRNETKVKYYIISKLQKLKHSGLMLLSQVKWVKIIRHLYI